MKGLFRVETTFRKQSYIYYVYAKSKCHAFNLVISHFKEMFPEQIYMHEFTDTFVGVVLNFLR